MLTTGCPAGSLGECGSIRPAASTNGDGTPVPLLEGSMVASTDAALVARCRQGDTSAFDELVRRHERRVLNIAYRLVRDPDAAHDLAQEAFVSAFRNLDRFRGNAAFATWLYRITYNVSMDELTRRKRAAARSIDTFYGENDDGTTGLDLADPAESPEDSSIRKERRQAILEAIAALPGKHKTVLMMFEIQGVSYEEMAELLDCPVGTVKSRLSRARLALLEALEPRLELFDAPAGRIRRG